MSAEKEVWPDYLMIRDTGLHDDAGGLGQRIFTTAGAGYKKVKYIRADIAERDAALRAADNRDAAGVCGHVHPRHLGSPLDKNGCQLPAGHAGEHRFVDDAGRAVLWNYDKECQCVDCMSPDGGYECTVYRFETAVPTPAAVPAGEAVAQTLRDALAYVGYRTDGDLSTLAERSELWMRESRVLIDSQSELIAWMKAGATTPQPADGEAVAWVCSPPENIAQHVGINSEERQKLIDAGFDVSHYRPLVYGDTRPPAAQVQKVVQAAIVEIRCVKFGEPTCVWQDESAPCVSCGTENNASVQAAPQEGEDAAEAYRKAWEAGHAAACELGAVRELVAKWRNRRNVGDFNYTPDHPALIAIRECADELEAAIQHRGDSRGGEGS